MNRTSRQLIESQSAACVIAGIDTLCEITYGDPTDNSAVRFDFDFPHAVARFTWWSDSSYVSEALTIDGRQIEQAHGYAVDGVAAAAIVRNLVVATKRANAT